MTDDNEIRLFWLEPTDRVRRSLRRFTFSTNGKPCPASQLGHDASVVLDEVAAKFGEARAELGGRRFLEMPDDVPHDHPLWPTQCSGCEYGFVDEDEWQVRQDLIYVAPDGADYTLRDAPVGAMWDAWWYSDHWKGPDGISLVVRTPGGDWIVDSRASNCRAPEDLKHWCWQRTGNPKDPQGDPPLHVAGNAGVCRVGAGSIGMPGYHGFLDHGYLRKRRRGR